MAADEAARDLRARLARLGGLVSVADLAEEWGVSKQRASVIADSRGFPAPVTGTRAGRHRYWLRAEVDEWTARNRGGI